MTSAPPAPRPGMKRAGILFVVLGLLAGAVSVIGLVAVIARDVVPDVNASTYSTPVDTSMALKSATYVIYQESQSGMQMLSPSDVRITGPSGQTIAVGTPSSSQDVDRNGKRYIASLSFVAPQAGSYHVIVSAEKQTSILVGHDLTQVGLRIVGWFFGCLLAAGALITGIVVLIVRSSRNRKEAAAWLGPQPWTQQPTQPWTQQPAQPWAQQPAQPWAEQPAQPQTQPQVQPQAQPLPAPGWYPDPAEPASGKVRWWDGQNWAP